MLNKKNIKIWMEISMCESKSKSIRIVPKRVNSKKKLKVESDFYPN